MRTQTREVKTGLVISLITILVVLGGLELIAHSWEQKTAQGPLGWTLVASRRLDFVTKGNEEYPYYVLKPESNYEWGGIPVEINSHGFRTDEFRDNKAEGTFRILNIGDSIVFGWGVPEDETYGKLLESQLNSFSSDYRFEVINAGLPTWNLSTERNFFLSDGLSLKPDAVILEITVLNDIYSQEVVDPNRTGLINWLRDNTYFWPFLTTQIRFIAARYTGPEAIPVLNPPKEAQAYFPLDTNDPVYDDLWNTISDIATACHNEGIPLILAIFPTGFQVNSASHPSTPQQAILERSKDSNVQIVDLLPLYSQYCSNIGGDGCEGYSNSLFADVWMHPSAFGHQIASKEIFNLITRYWSPALHLR